MNGIKISPFAHWEENLSLIIISLGFLELMTEKTHDILKWPMIGLGIVALVLCFLFHAVNSKIKWLIVSVVVLTILEILFSEGLFSTQYIWDIGICMPVGLCIYHAKKVNIKKWITLYIVVTLYLLMRLVTSPNHYNIFYSHSRNYISIFEIFLLFLTAVIANKSNDKLPEWMYYVTVIVCILAIGRGGILAGFLIFFLHLFHTIHAERDLNNKSAKILLLIIVFGFAVLCFALYKDDIIQRFFPRFSSDSIYSDASEAAASKRLLMWKAYIDACVHSLKLFVLGADPNPIVLKYRYVIDFNLHNSFIMTHVFYGIVGVVAVIKYSVRFINGFCNERKTDTVIIFLGLLFRSLFDHCFPGKLSAIAIWIVIFYGINRRGRLVYKLKLRGAASNNE